MDCSFALFILHGKGQPICVTIEWCMFIYSTIVCFHVDAVSFEVQEGFNVKGRFLFRAWLAISGVECQSDEVTLGKTAACRTSRLRGDW
jgi:hypothetical protein